MSEVAVALPQAPQVDLRRLTAERVARLREALDASGYDAVVATTPESVTYASGYRSVSGGLFRTHQMAVVLTADDAWLVAPAADAAPAVDTGISAERVVPFGRFYFEAVDGSPVADMADRHDGFSSALRAAIAAARPQRLAVENIVGELSDLASVVDDGTPLINSVRGAKQPDEIPLLAYAAQLAETAVDAALGDADEGITELELARRIAATMVAGGADPRFVVATVGHRSALADAYPTHKPWRRGEIARFDVGCVYNGYWSDIGRTAVLGEPTAEQERRYAALLAGEEAQFDFAKPGIKAAEVFDRAVDVVTANGVEPYRRHHCGHGIGLAVYEPPIISPGVEQPLAEGMTFCFETPYYELGWGGMMVEDTVVVTAEGVELLTRTGRGLRVVQP
jgi:Xaa-Pro aminopeptidase